MAKRSLFTKMLMVSTSFAGGLALGLLLAPESGKQTRNWINKRAGGLANWASDRRNNALDKSEKRLEELRRRVHQGIKNNIPDLYEATEELDLDDRALLDS